MKSRLLTPAQAQIPQRVVAAMTKPLPVPRSEEFRVLFREVCAGLGRLFQTEHQVLTLTTSGTGAMEAAMVNFLRQGDKVITIEGGKFGARWGEIARIYGLRVVALQIPWGESACLEQLKALLPQHPDAAALFLTHSETSTGAAFDVHSITQVVRAESEALVIVDGISAVGVLPFYKDDWGIDVCVSASQKATMLPPGLAFLAVSEKGWRQAENANLPRHYFDILKAREALALHDTPWTPATALIAGLREALRMILDEGLQQRWQEYAALAQAVRAAAQAIGLDLFARSPSNAVTAIQLPQGIDGREFVRQLRSKYGVTVAGGQEHLKGKIFRVAHMGDCDLLDIIAFASAMELALRDLGWRYESGKTIAAAQAAYANHASPVE
ncbi:MAG: alanine--glyoxylate aminotransferase family protein [Acidiferrobacterales bacterium]|nr:alanine--glyoxylate aminotransferase family protein [Gammaproteobacteria bacterium]